MCMCTNVFIICVTLVVMQVTTVQLRLRWCKSKGKAKFLCFKASVNQGNLAGTHVGKWTAVVKIVRIFQTKYP